MSENKPTTFKTAVITGGCSGIGLGLVQHLLAKPNWRVVIADIRPEAYTAIAPTLDESRTLFVATNVASWDEQAALFKKGYEWSNGRLDFFAANAGIGDKESVVGQFDLDAEPEKPNLLCLEVDETAVFYGLKLFIHYSRKTKRALKDSPSSIPFNPKMVITASCAGLYPFAVAPQYTAAKHSLIGLTRTAGPQLLAMDNIAVNCICPAYVATPLQPPGMNDAWPAEWVTPISTMIRAYDELIDDDGKVEQDGLSDGENGVVKSGQSVECVVNKLFYRQHVPFADESQKFLIEESAKPDGIWIRTIMGSLQKGPIKISAPST